MSGPVPGIAELRAAYAAGKTTPIEVVENLQRAFDQNSADPTWITLADRDTLSQAGREASEHWKTNPSSNLSLRGIPFAIKDNIDVAGLRTTAACPEFAYRPDVSAFVVQRMIEAGAIPVGKTNLDQFATGLVGLRSPYGAPENPFNSEFIPGGSSSGSAVAVARGLCSFALGTDTAGSGRVPAAFNELVGFKPTRGLLSTRGVVPACRTLDCVSIFSRSVADADEVFRVAAVFDAEDPFARPAPRPRPLTWPIRVGIPRAGQQEFFGDGAAQALFAEAVEKMRALGAVITEIDFSPFRAAAGLLYEGAWVAERYAAIKDFVQTTPQALHPVTRQIIEGARTRSAVDAFESTYQLAKLRRETESIWAEIDCLLLPTTPTTYKVSDVVANPIQLNSNLGYYTNFVNLLDLCAIALPAGRLPSGVPWGITLMAPAFQDHSLLDWGAKFLGESPPNKTAGNSSATSTVRVAVCGAHLSRLPLNKQLLERDSRLVAATRTSPDYRLYALPNTTPPKPGMVRVSKGGAAIEVEVWEMPLSHFGSFVAGIPAPLGIGQVKLADGTEVHGFTCEAAAVENAEDISHFGGWRAYLASINPVR